MGVIVGYGKGLDLVANAAGGGEFIQFQVHHHGDFGPVAAALLQFNKFAVRWLGPGHVFPPRIFGVEAPGPLFDINHIVPQIGKGAPNLQFPRIHQGKNRNDRENPDRNPQQGQEGPQTIGPKRKKGHPGPFSKGKQPHAYF